MSDTLVVWREFETAVRNNLVKYIGISNCYDINVLKELYETGTHSPYSLTHSLTYALTHSLTYSLTHTLTHSLTLTCVFLLEIIGELADGLY